MFVVVRVTDGHTGDVRLSPFHGHANTNSCLSMGGHLGRNPSDIYSHVAKNPMLKTA